MSLARLLSHPTVGYRSITGDTAVGHLEGFSLVDHYLSVFDDRANDISAKLPHASRPAFDVAAAGMRNNLAKGLLQHQEDQRRAVRARALPPEPAVQRARYASPSAEGTTAFAPSPAAPQPAQPSPTPPRVAPAGGGPASCLNFPKRWKKPVRLPVSTIPSVRERISSGSSCHAWLSGAAD
jgi:hypothetical protein